MNDKIKYKSNRNYALKYSSINGFVLIFIGFFFLKVLMFIVNISFQPDVKPININEWVFWLVSILIAFTWGVNKFFRLRNFLDDREDVYQIYATSTSLAIIKNTVLDFKHRQSLVEKRMDFLKLFSPIPLLIYILGLWIDNKPILNTSISLFFITLPGNQFLKYLAGLLTLLYLAFLSKVFSDYKKFSKQVYKLESAANLFEEKNSNGLPN